MFEQLAESVQKVNDSVNSVHKKLQGHQNTMSNALEHQVAVAVKDYLQDATILFVNYRWQRIFQGFTNETDAIVIGLEGGVETVVLCEAKLNMNKNWEDAVEQVRSSLNRWKRLCELYDKAQATPDSVGKHDMKDIELLRIEDHKDKELKVALGGQVFPVSLCPSVSKRLGADTKWLYVHMNGAEARVEPRN
jgi:hypothetical protein